MLPAFAKVASEIKGSPGEVLSQQTQEGAGESLASGGTPLDSSREHRLGDSSLEFLIQCV